MVDFEQWAENGDVESIVTNNSKKGSKENPSGNGFFADMDGGKNNKIYKRN